MNTIKSIEQRLAMEKLLVSGYTMINSEGLEVLFAKYPDGTIKTCVREYSNTFNNKTNVWKECERISREAEYCGQYNMFGIMN